MRAVLESSRGAGGTPVRIIEFTTGTHDQKIDVIRPQEYRSSYFGHYSSAIGTEINSFKIDGDLSYEMAAWLGKVFVNGAATASGATAVTWAFTPLGTADNLKSALVEFGYGDGIGATAPAWSVPYVCGDQLTIKWDKKASQVGFTADLLSPKVATQISAFTGTPSAPTVTLMSPSVTKVYIDTTTIGSTADNYVISAEWQLKNNFKNLYTLNGTNAAQDSFRPDLLEWTLKLDRYYINDTELDARNAGTLRKVRVESTGPTLGGGTYKGTWDFYGVYSARTLAETDNLGIEQFTLEPQSPDGSSADYSMTIIEGDATIT